MPNRGSCSTDDLCGKEHKIKKTSTHYNHHHHQARSEDFQVPRREATLKQ